MPNLSNMFSWRHRNASETKKLNPNMEKFEDTVDELDSVIDKNSVINTSTEGYLSQEFSSYSDMIYMPILTNKFERIKQYRNIAKYSEVDWCIEEIADDFAHTDEDGNVVKLIINENAKGLNNDNRKKIIQEEFAKFISLFNFDRDLFTLVKNYVTEGEIAYENIIDAKEPTKGIIGVKYLPTEYFETLIDANTKSPVGIYFDLDKLEMDQSNLVSRSYSSGSKIFQASPSFSGIYGGSTQTQSSKAVALRWPQLTYIASNNTNTSESIIYPILEKCKDNYHQLSLLHDSAIILRVTRAPERLLFNITTGGMSDKVAKRSISKFVENFKSKKTVSSDGEIGKGYNPHTMLESYFFWKTEESGGTEIESVGGSASYDQMDDIEYFLARLFKSFKVPFSRFKQPENTMERDDSITYEEYSFFKQIIRIQKIFGAGFKASFITHLKLRKLYEQYNIKDSDLNVVFTPPALFELYQSSKLLQIKSESYDLLADKEEFSKRIAMKKIFGMDDAEIDENFKEVEKEMLQQSVIEYYKEQIEELGPLESNPAIKWANGDDE